MKYGLDVLFVQLAVAVFQRNHVEFQDRRALGKKQRFFAEIRKCTFFK